MVETRPSRRYADRVLAAVYTTAVLGLVSGAVATLGAPFKWW